MGENATEIDRTSVRRQKMSNQQASGRHPEEEKQEKRRYKRTEALETGARERRYVATSSRVIERPSRSIAAYTNVHTQNDNTQPQHTTHNHKIKTS